MRFTGGVLKLSKRYWTLKDYEWKDGKHIIINRAAHSLHASVDGEKKEISQLSADKRRVLVGVPINLMHKNDQLIRLHDEKIEGHIDKLSSNTLKPNDISFGYEYCWWPSLKYPTPALHLDMSLNALSKLHAKMLQKLGVMKTFSILMRSTPAFLGGLGVHLLEVEAIAQAIHHLISLCSADALTKSLLKTIAKRHQIELGTDKHVLKLDYDLHSVLTTPAWITSL